MTTVKKNIHNEPNTIATYLKEISKVPLLSQEEETALALRAASGDTNAKNKILSANLRFVVNIAKKYQNRGLDLEDLISEGNIGLMTAIERFDVTKGYKFISYAVWWIRQSILKALNDKSRMIRIPSNRTAELAKINYARRNVSFLDKSEEREIAEVAKSLGMAEMHVRDLINISKEMVSLDCEVSSSDSGRTTIGDFMEDTKNPSPEEKAFDSALKDALNQLLQDKLTEREAEVLRARFGLDGNESISLKDLGVRLNLSKERVRQIEKKALHLLRNCEDTCRLEGYVA